MSNTQKNVVVTLADGSVAATQSASDNSTKVATTAYADAAGGSSTPRMTISTCFEDQSINFNRFDKNATNGAATMNTTGLLLDTNATQGGDANVTLKQWSTTDIFGSNPIFDAIVYRSSTGTDYEFYIGTGAVDNSEITGLSNLTVDQMGFKFIMASSSETKYATNGNGATETAGAITHTSVQSGLGLDLHSLVIIRLCQVIQF